MTENVQIALYAAQVEVSDSMRRLFQFWFAYIPLLMVNQAFRGIYVYILLNNYKPI